MMASFWMRNSETDHPMRTEPVSGASAAECRLADDAFEREFAVFLREQMKRADGQRLEKLREDLTGTKLLLKEVVRPVFRSFADLELEYGVRTRTGARIFVDVFHKGLRIAFEEEHFVTHAEKVTRDRFAFERFRARSLANVGLIYYPYSRDEILKRPDMCRRDLHELIGMLGSRTGGGLAELSLQEREVIRGALAHGGTFRPGDAAGWLNVDPKTARRVLKRMESKHLVRRVGGGDRRVHAYELTDGGRMTLQPHV